MISAFGVEHGEISKLSGYDYHKGGQHYVANRVGWSEQNEPHEGAKSSAKYAAKRAGKFHLISPKTWKKENRTKSANAAHGKALEKWKTKEGKYTQEVWEHKNTGTGARRHTQSAGLHETPFKGSYKTWDKKDRSKSVSAVAKGLPRYLKDISPNVGVSGKRTFRGGTKLSRDDYTYSRVRAHQSGKQASQAHSKWKKAADQVASEGPLTGGNFGRAEELRKPVVEAAQRGRLGRMISQKAIKDNTPKRRQDRGKLP